MAKNRPKPPRAAPEKAGGVARHLEGWQLGLVTVLMAALSLATAFPRSVAPYELPEPHLEPAALERIARDEAALARAAEQDKLHIDVRALGSAVRAYGLVDAAEAAEGGVKEHRDVADAARQAQPHGLSTIAKLRAFQLRSFLRELRRWESTGEESAELRELGGGFLRNAKRNGWIGPRRGLLMDRAVMGALFKKRWDEVTGLSGGPLDLTLAENRALYRFLLLHPPREEDLSGYDAARLRNAELASHLQAEQYRLKKIGELQLIDPDYPADLARGVILYRSHRYALALEAFRKHLDEHPDGPLTVRVQNYQRAALEKALSTPQ